MQLEHYEPVTMSLNLAMNREMGGGRSLLMGMRFATNVRDPQARHGVVPHWRDEDGSGSLPGLESAVGWLGLKAEDYRGAE